MTWNYLFMLGLKLIHVSESSHRYTEHLVTLITYSKSCRQNKGLYHAYMQHSVLCTLKYIQSGLSCYSFVMNPCMRFYNILTNISHTFINVCIQLGVSTWWPLLAPLSWCHIFSICNSFEDQTLVGLFQRWPNWSAWWGLTLWGWVMHICVSTLTIIGSDNGL